MTEMLQRIKNRFNVQVFVTTWGAIMVLEVIRRGMHPWVG